MVSSRASEGVYVFDSGPLMQLFRHFDPDVFPHLWEDFDRLVASGRIVSVREVHREIRGPENLIEWAEQNKAVFHAPDSAQTEFVQNLFGSRHAQKLVRKKKILEGGGAADPFVIALAKVKGGCVVTAEADKPNAPCIPAFCKGFDIPFMNLSQFMKAEGWEFVRK